MTRRPWTPYDPTLPIWRSNLVRDQLQPTWGNLPEFPTCLGRSLWGLQVLSSHYVCSITCSCLSTQPPFVPGCFHNRPSPFGTRPFQWVFRWKVWISEMVDREHLCIFFFVLWHTALCRCAIGGKAFNWRLMLVSIGTALWDASCLAVGLKKKNRDRPK